MMKTETQTGELPQRERRLHDSLRIIENEAQRLRRLLQNQTPPGQIQNVALLGRAESIYRWRRYRDETLGADLFGEPGFDLLLELYISQANGRESSVSSLGLDMPIPPTTVLRYVDRLVRMGWIDRRPDQNDSRRYFVSLTDPAIRSMERMLAFETPLYDNPE